MTAPVAVIGGGLAGLAAAVALTRAGLRATVYERDDAPGGRARSWTDARTGEAVDIGPHILLDSYANMLDLLRQLGTHGLVRFCDDRFITLVEGRRAIALRSRRLPAPLPFLPSVLAVPSLTLREKFAAARPLKVALRMGERDVAALDGESAEAFLRRLGVPPRAVDWYWRLLAMFLLNVPLERASAGALMRLFMHLASHNHLAPGFARVGLSELYVPPARRLIEQAGGAVRCGCAVRQLAFTGDALTGLWLADGSFVAATQCVVAVPPQELTQLLPEPAWRQAAPGAARLEPSPYIACYLWFDQRLSGEWFWARANARDSWSCEFYDLANIRERPGGSLIATNIIYSSRLGTVTDAAVVDRVQEELAEFLPAARTGLRHARVHRIPMAIPAPSVGAERLRPPCESALRGLFLAGDWTATALPASMESAVRSGRLAADALCRAAGVDHREAIPPPAPQGFARFTRRRRR